jgi:hypothetical protein
MKPKTLLILLVVVCSAIAGVMLGLPKFNGWQFQDEVSSIAKFETGRSDEDLRALVLKKAKDHDVDIRAEDIVISHDNNTLTITVDYSVVVDLKVKQVVLEFHIVGPKN